MLYNGFTGEAFLEQPLVVYRCARLMKIPHSCSVSDTYTSWILLHVFKIINIKAFNSLINSFLVDTQQ